MLYLNRYINNKLSSDDYELISFNAKKEIEELIQKRKGKFEVQKYVKNDKK